MAGPQFVGPTGAQYGAQNMDALQRGLDGIRQLGQFVEAQRQFNEQEKRLNRTLNAQAQQKIFDNLIASTDSGSIQEVAEKFGPALAGMFETWGLGPNQASELLETLKNTELSGPQALQWFMSISAKYGEGGTSADVLKAAEQATAPYVKTTPVSGTGEGTGAGASAGAGVKAATGTKGGLKVTKLAAGTPAVSPSGQLDAVERLKQTISEQLKGTPGTKPAEVYNAFRAGLTSEADKKAVDAWFNSDEWDQFLLVARDFRGPASTVEFTEGRPGTGPGLGGAGPVAVKPNVVDAVIEQMKGGLSQSAAAAAAPAGTSVDPAKFRKWLVEVRKWNDTHPPGTAAWVNPDGDSDLTKDPGNAGLVEEYRRSQGGGSASADPAVATTTSAAGKSLGETAVSNAQAATADLMNALNSLVAGDASMSTKAQAQRAYSSVGLAFTPAALSAAKKDPQALAKYRTYFKGLTQDPEAMLAMYAVTNPEAAATLQASISASNDPVAKMKYMAEYATAYAKLYEAGMTPAKIDLEMKKLGFDTSKSQADAAKAMAEVAAFALVPPEQQNAIANLVAAAEKVRVALKEEKDTAQKVVLQQQLVKLTDTLNLATKRLATYLTTADRTVNFTPVTIDPKTYEWKSGGVLGLFNRTRNKVAVPGTQEGSAQPAPVTNTPTNPIEDQLTADYGS